MTENKTMEGLALEFLEDGYVKVEESALIKYADLTYKTGWFDALKSKSVDKFIKNRKKL